MLFILFRETGERHLTLVYTGLQGIRYTDFISTHLFWEHNHCHCRTYKDQCPKLKLSLSNAGLTLETRFLKDFFSQLFEVRPCCFFLW